MQRSVGLYYKALSSKDVACALYYDTFSNTFKFQRTSQRIILKVQ